MRQATLAAAMAALTLPMFSLAEAAPGPSGVVIPASTSSVRGYAQDSILVRFKPAASPSTRAAARGQVNGSLVRSYHLVPGLEHVTLHGGLPVAKAIAILEQLPNVDYAQPNWLIGVDAPAPSDEYFGEQWALDNSGQQSGWGVWPAGTADADIDWPEAWAARAGGGSVVAVLDTGIDYRHTDLAANVWQNTAEASGIPGVDDDGNGYVDDIRGWDFANNDNNPLDGHGHGTHVAGTIAAVANNNKGVAGVMWSGQVMALKILTDGGMGVLSDAIAALEYATAMGVRVSNNSWGYAEYTAEEAADHQALYQAIAAAQADGHLFVAAAGNDGVNSDNAPHYPSSFDLDNIISVGAADNTDQLAFFSNYGLSSVDLAAPGDYVFSTYKLFAGSIDDYGWLSGTSMATPHVAGVAGLLVGLQPGWTYGQVRDQILNHVRVIGALAGTSATGGLLNIQAALAGVADAGGGGGGGGGGGATIPDTPAGLGATDQGDGSVLLGWADVTGEDGYQLEREWRHKKRGYISATSLQADADATSLTDTPGAGDYRYRIRSFNAAGYSSWSIWVEVTIAEAGGGGGGGGSDKPCRGRNCP